ncbi:hypothetical protein [Jannaschia pohangensis]|uniref:Uncharacterized protein n=1 Tax=Jannaschia pohangensis TaxID=390807 RepID=A0A1I3NMT3_9RHOB|nr:hypothetical protein [Jannaschia pohangensis]SFJ10525.1 hypothetical protein SAMN04488095_2198 [Jannaschia pohangensis]
MSLSDFLHDVSEHLRIYLLAGTLVAVGVDVAGNVSGSMRGAPGTAMADMGMSLAPQDSSLSVLLAIQAIGAMIALVGGVLYLANMWSGFLALRAFRFRFKERGPLLKACGWSAAFAYILISAVIGLAVNAVYLALVG